MKKIVFTILVLAVLKSSAQIACVNYNTSNSPLPDNTVYSIASHPLDSTTYDNIWIGTNGGLVHYNTGNWTIYTMANGLPDNSIRSVYVAPDSTVWCGTFTSGLVKFKNGIFTNFNTANSALPDNFVKAFGFESPSTLWIGTTGGFAKIKNDTITAYNLSQLGLESNHVASVSVRGDGVKIIGMINGGFAYFNDTTFTFYTNNNSGLPDNTIAGIAVDEQGNPYMAMPSGGLVAHFGGNTFQVYNQGTIPGMESNSFRCVVKDPWGFWAGSVDKGVFRKMGTGNFINQANLGIVTPTVPADFILCGHFTPYAFKNQYLNGWFGSDQGGLYNITAVTGVNQTPVDNSVTLWQGTNGELLVKAGNKLLQVQAYSIDGRLLADTKPEGTSTLLNLSNNHGMVIIRAVTTKGIAVGKVVVE
jgi:ligand-binding sensor domain-containing protein